MHFLVKTLSVVTTVAAASLMAMGINTFSHQSQAVASTSNALTGSCGGAWSFQKKGRARPFGHGQEVNVLFVVDFDAKKIYTSFTEVDSAKYSTSIEAPFDIKTITSEPGLPGASKVTFENTEKKLISMYLLPVNGGTTYLVQIINDDITGICQKI